jgi:hypothetical protein
MKTRADYIAAMKVQLDELNVSMAVLEAKAKQASADMQAKYKSGIDTLRKQQVQALDKLEELKQAGDDSWEHMIDNMEKVRDAFVDSYKHFKAQF